MSSVTIRIDEQTKTQAAKIAEDFGFDLSSVTRAFYRQMVREQRIPLNLSYHQPNADSIESLNQAEEIRKAGKPRYKNAEEMFEALDI